MTALRWTLGIILTALGGGFVVLSIVGGGFRKSFGASDINPLVQILPLVAMALLLAGVVMPSNKLLLHTGAIAAAALIALCLWQLISESATVMLFAIAILAVWLVFYWRTAWRS